MNWPLVSHAECTWQNCEKRIIKTRYIINNNSRRFCCGLVLFLTHLDKVFEMQTVPRSHLRTFRVWSIYKRILTGFVPPPRTYHHVLEAACWSPIGNSYVKFISYWTSPLFRRCDVAFRTREVEGSKLVRKTFCPDSFLMTSNMYRPFHATLTMYLTFVSMNSTQTIPSPWYGFSPR